MSGKSFRYWIHWVLHSGYEELVDWNSLRPFTLTWCDIVKNKLWKVQGLRNDLCFWLAKSKKQRLDHKTCFAKTSPRNPLPESLPLNDEPMQPGCTRFSWPEWVEKVLPLKCSTISEEVGRLNVLVCSGTEQHFEFICLQTALHQFIFYKVKNYYWLTCLLKYGPFQAALSVIWTTYSLHSQAALEHFHRPSEVLSSLRRPLPSPNGLIAVSKSTRSLYFFF